MFWYSEFVLKQSNGNAIASDELSNKQQTGKKFAINVHAEYQENVGWGIKTTD